MLDFSNLFIVIFLVVCGAVFLLYLVFGIVFIARKKFKRTKFDIAVLTITAVIMTFMVGSTVLVSLLYAGIVVYTNPFFVAISGGFLGPIVVGIALAAVVFCFISHLVKALGVQRTGKLAMSKLKSAKKHIQEGQENLAKCIKLEENAREKERLDKLDEADKGLERVASTIAYANSQALYKESEYKLDAQITQHAKEVEVMLLEKQEREEKERLEKGEQESVSQEYLDTLALKVFDEVREFAKTDEIAPTAIEKTTTDKTVTKLLKSKRIRKAKTITKALEKTFDKPKASTRNTRATQTRLNSRASKDKALTRYSNYKRLGERDAAAKAFIAYIKKLPPEAQEKVKNRLKNIEV